MKIELQGGAASLRKLIGDARRYVALIRRFRAYLRPQLPRLGLATIAALAYTLVVLIEPWPIQVLFDGVLLHKKVHLGPFPLHIDAPAILISGSIFAIVALAVLRGQIYASQNVLASAAGQEVVSALRRELFRKFQQLSLRYHRRARSGDVLMRLTGDITMLRDMVVATLVSLFTQTLVVTGAIVIMAIVNLRLTLVAIAVMPLLFAILTIFRIRLAEAASQQRKREGALASSTHEVLQAIQVVQAYTAEPFENERFRRLNKRSLRAGLRSVRLESELNRNVQVATAVGLAATLGFGIREVLAGVMTPGHLLVFLAYVRGLYGPLRQISKTTQRMARAAACGDRVLEVLNEPLEIEDPAEGSELPPLQGRITFRRVTFRYGGDRAVLRDFDLDISPRETVALVGPTGSGKSTLLNLIPRFFDPERGEVLIDGTGVRSVRLASLRRQIAYLSQEAVVMGVSIRDNIAYGIPSEESEEARSPSQEAIERASRAAHAHEFIVRLPRGYDTVVGERGATLSGGQRQRIALARMLYRGARILLLDEPTTGLDPLAERAVLEALEEATRDRTAVIVAHHLATVLHADRIVFLLGGRIVEQGTHEELVARDGPYAEFVRSQWGSMAARTPAVSSTGSSSNGANGREGIFPPAHRAGAPASSVSDGLGDRWTRNRVLALGDGRRLLEEACGPFGWRIREVVSVEIVHERPASRLTLRYRVLASRGTEAPRLQVLYGKLYRGGRATRTRDVLVALQGMVGSGIRFPEIVGHSERRRFLVLAQLAGLPFSERLERGSEAEIGCHLENLARALAILHGIRPERLPVLPAIQPGWRWHGPIDELEVIRRAGARVRDSALPRQVVARLEAVAVTVSAALEEGGGPWKEHARMLHRDLHPGQIQVGENEVGLLDLDEAAWGEPELDVGNVVAHLWLADLRTRGVIGPAELRTRAFLSTYASCLPLREDRLACYRDAALLRLASLERLASPALSVLGWERLAEGLLEATGDGAVA